MSSARRRRRARRVRPRTTVGRVKTRVRTLAAEAGHTINPIEQFSVESIVPIHIGHLDFSFTNSALYMIIAVAIVSALMLIGANGTTGAPGRLQAIAEMAYEF